MNMGCVSGCSEIYKLISRISRIHGSFKAVGNYLRFPKNCFSADIDVEEIITGGYWRKNKLIQNFSGKFSSKQIKILFMKRLRKIKFGDSLYHQFQIRFYSHLLSKIVKNYNFYPVLCTDVERTKTKVFEKMILGKIFGTKRD